ncbi:IS4 family transposase, partial [Clostridium gasigenes]|uniref:IS4 family transposase n=1 Tax=Clostridium gasigenes TaxID=94869 RepID=UPI001C0CF299
MNKRIKQLLKSLKELYSSQVIKDIALKTKFMKRESKLTPEIFLSLCLFDGDDLCRSSLLQLSSRLGSKEDIKISPQALDKRFNKESVEFLKVIFREMLKRQNKILREGDALLKAHFKAIKIVDSTVISLPEHLKSTFRGTGGSSSDSSVKIQLEYELLTGSFLGCDIFEGVSNDMEYLPTLQQNIEAKELHLKDLGYFKSEHFKFIEKSGAYYLSKIRSTTAIYIKNDNPEIMSNGNVKK